MWHHADALAGTASQAQQYQQGYGVDGFGNDSYGGDGGFGRGRDGGKNSGDYLAFRAPIVNDFKNGKPLSSLGEATISKWNNYTSKDGQYQFVTPNWDGLIANEPDQDYYYSGHSSDESYLFEENALVDEIEMGGWGKARSIVETGGISFETTEQGIVGAQRLGNAVGGTTSEILSAGNVGKIAGTGLGVLNMVLTTGDGVSNGWKNHHTADLIVSATEIGLGLFEVTSPVGWAFGAAMFVGDLISENYTGHTITENIFDNE